MNVQNTQYIHKTFIQINFHKRDSKSNTNVHTWYPIANWAQDAEDLSIIELNVKKLYHIFLINGQMYCFSLF